MSTTFQTIIIITTIVAGTAASVTVSWRVRRTLCRRFDAQAAALRILARPMQPPGPHQPRPASRPHHQ